MMSNETVLQLQHRLLDSGNWKLLQTDKSPDKKPGWMI